MDRVFEPPAAGGVAPGEELPQPEGFQNPEELFPEGGYPFLQPENEPTKPLNLVPRVTEAQTGRFMFGVGVNSNLGLVGNIILDEQNFDWRRVPTSWEDVRRGTAFRGGGQQFRIEAVPGTVVSRYMFTFRQPYLLDTRVGFGLNGFFFKRFYRDWTEERLGGRVSLGYQFSPDLSGGVALRAENINISNPRTPSPPELQRVLGNNGLYSVKFNLTHDTRDTAFLPTQGHFVDASFEQAFGDFSFPRFILEGRQHFLLHERPDGSGRHVLSVSSDVGVSGTDTPIFENFYAGGYTTLRGFYFRSASPQNMNVLVGGRFQWINSVEYMFPLTADDALRGVIFCDFGTVEPSVELKGRDFRVAPGIGLRISVPALGPAPIALDFAVPVAHSPGDRLQIFSFNVGLGRY